MNDNFTHCTNSRYEQHNFSVRSILCMVALFVLSTANTLSQDTLTNQMYLSAAFGQHYGTSAIDFFSKYRAITGGELTRFNSASALNVSTTLPYNEHFRLGLQIQSYLLDAKETHSQPVIAQLSSDTIGYRSLFEDFQARVIPVFVTAEFYAVRAQFQTYVTASIGVGITDIFWSESVQSSVPDDIRKGGLHLDETVVHPAIKVGVGSELGFDAFLSGSSLHSLFFEVSYSWIGTQLTPFQNVARQLTAQELEKVDNTDANYSVNTGGLTALIGLRIFIAREG